jgi:UDP-glucose 4-epimerase
VAVLVTGGAGFIGSHVAEALAARGEDVVVLDDLSSGRRENLPEGVELVEGDIREPLAQLFASVRPTVCYHLAAQIDVRVSVARPEHDALINVIGTVNLLQAALERGAKIVFSSTGGAIYGECEGPASEDAPRRPIAPYGTSKLAAEEYLATFNRLHGTTHVSLRYGNVYGPRQDPHGEAGVVAIFFNKLRDGETPKVFGDGRQTRDYVYVGDVVRATLAATERDGGVYNVGTGRETSVVELLDLCQRVAGTSIEPEFAPARQGELQRNVLDPSRAVDELAWRPERSLEDGLRETWEFFSATGGSAEHG